MAEKHRHAHQLRDHHDIPFEVAVDDIDGTLHRAFAPKPNSAYLVDPTGTITFRSHWANDEPALRRALEQAASGKTVHGRSRAMAGPLLRPPSDISRASSPLPGAGPVTTSGAPRPHSRSSVRSRASSPACPPTGEAPPRPPP